MKVLKNYKTNEQTLNFKNNIVEFIIIQLEEYLSNTIYSCNSLY